jgi:hypothetical protein
VLISEEKACDLPSTTTKAHAAFFFLVRDSNHVQY